MYAPGSIIRNPETLAVHVVLDHVWADFGRACAHVDPKMPYRPDVTPVNRLQATWELVEAPYYKVGRLNPTTWSVIYAAPGRNGLHHVFAQADTLVAAQRLAVTQNLLRAAGL